MEYEQFPFVNFDGTAFGAWLGGQKEGVWGGEKGDTSRMVEIETIYWGSVCVRISWTKLCPIS